MLQVRQASVFTHPAAFNAIIAAVLVTDVSGCIVQANAAAAQILGLPVAQMIGAPFTTLVDALIGGDGVPLHTLHYPDYPAAGTGLLPGYREVLLRRLDGTTRFLLLGVEPITDDQGAIEYLVGSALDITPLRTAQEELRLSEERFRMLIEQAPEAILLYDVADDQLVSVNRSAQAVFGRTREDLLQHSPESLFSQDQLDGRSLHETFAEHRERVLAGEEVTIERLVHNPLRGERLCEIRLVLLPAKRMLIRASVIDATEQRATDARLRTLTQAVVQSPVGVMITDRHGTIDYVNPRFCQVTGYAPEEVIGKSPRILQSGMTSPEQYQELWKTIRNGDVWFGTFVNLKKNGELFWASSSISAIHNPTGEITHYLSVSDDITEYMRTHERLRTSEARYRAIVEAG